MKKLTFLVLLIVSIVLIFLSKESFYSTPIKTIYNYDGDYKVGGERYDKNDKLLETFTLNSEIIDGRIVESEEVVFHTYWGKVRGSLFYIAIVASAFFAILLFYSFIKKTK